MGAPRVLRIVTGYARDAAAPHTLDYSIYDGFPAWLRRVEKLLRLDFYLALRARRLASSYDVLFASSEKVAIPLSLLGVDRPLATNVYNLATPAKEWLVRALALARGWAAVGYVTPADRDFLAARFGVPPERLFVSHAAQVDTFTPGETVRSGPIISLGVARRDYPTLFEALRQLEGFETEIYCQSRYGDPFAKDRLGALPPCVRFVDTVPDDALPTVYREARFVVVPLLDSRILSAGASVVMEASAAGKAVIATRNPGMSSLIEDGVSGILVPPGDAAALRTAIRELWEDPERATQLGLAARERVVQRYRPAVVYAGIREMLDRLYRAAGSPA